MPGISERGTAGSKPPASPSVTMQYVTSTPASVHVATVPAAPKSTSSGWALTTRARSTSIRATLPSPPMRPWVPRVGMVLAAAVAISGTVVAVHRFDDHPWPDHWDARILPYVHFVEQHRGL